MSQCLKVIQKKEQNYHIPEWLIFETWHTSMVWRPLDMIVVRLILVKCQGHSLEEFWSINRKLSFFWVFMDQATTADNLFLIHVSMCDKSQKWVAWAYYGSSCFQKNVRRHFSYQHIVRTALFLACIYSHLTQLKENDYSVYYTLFAELRFCLKSSCFHACTELEVFCHINNAFLRFRHIFRTLGQRLFEIQIELSMLLCFLVF